MKLSLPFPPSLNHYWRYTPRGVLISKRGRAYRNEVYAAILEQRGSRPLIMDRIGVSVELCAPDKRRRDIDNYVKAMLDALVHGQVIGDDSQVDRLLIHRGGITKPGRCYVEIELL